MTGHRPRPARITRPAVVLAALAAAFFVIARTTGSGWVTVLLCGMVGCLGAGAAWPFVAVGRATVAVDGPRDGTVGQPLLVNVQVTLGMGLRLRLVTPSGLAFSADAPAAGQVVATPEQRGVLDAVTVDVSSAAPLGLVWWSRVLAVPLAAPLEVGPRRLEVSAAELNASGATGLVEPARGRTGHDSVKTVRSYVAGDAVRLVHWPATARWGHLMVKEMEDPEVPRVAIVVDLSRGGARAEEAASRAAGLAEAVLYQGVPVTLITAERVGPVVGEVTSSLEVGRRLARAVGGAPPDGPVPAGAVMVRVDR